MEVGIQTQVGRKALHCGDGTTLASGETTCCEVSPVPAEHRVHERMAHRTEQLAVVGESRSELEGQRQHELSERCSLGQHVLDEICRGFSHSSSQTRWTKAQPLTGETDDDALGAFWACQHCEASRKHSAVDITLELLSHEPGQWRGETLLDSGVERAEVVAHDLVQSALLWAPPRVPWLFAHRHRRGLGNGRASVRCAGLALLPTAPAGDGAVRRRRAPGHGRHQPESRAARATQRSRTKGAWSVAAAALEQRRSKPAPASIDFARAACVPRTHLVAFESRFCGGS